MFLRIYKINHPVIILLIFLLTGIIWSLAFVNAKTYAFPAYSFEMPLYYLFFQWFKDFPLLARIISFFLILFQSIQINQLNNKYFLLEERTYIPSLLYILLCGFFPMQNLHPVLFANIFLLISLNKIFSTYRNDTKWLNYFDVGILISIASLFYIKYAFFIIIIWFSLFILRPFRGREWLVSILGFLVPYFFVLTYFFAFQENMQFKIQLYFSQLFEATEISNFNLAYYIYFVLLSFLTLVSSLKIIKTLQKQKVSVRRFFQVFFWLFVLAVFLFNISEYSNPAIITVAIISLSFLISNYILNIKSKFWQEIVFLMILICSILFQLTYYTNLL